MDYFEIIDKAYKKFLESNKVEDRTIYYNELINKINKDDVDICDRDFIDNFYIGPKANTFAAEGAGKSTRLNYYIFMGDENTKEIMKKYRDTRKNCKVKGELFNKLRDNSIFLQLERYGFVKNTPKLYVNRMMLILFPEICTTIANYSDLKNVAKLLGIDVGNEFNKAIFNVHYQVRGKIQSYLKDKGIADKLNDLEKAEIAWNILDKK
jgi:hypothetical protein